MCKREETTEPSDDVFSGLPGLEVDGPDAMDADVETDQAATTDKKDPLNSVGSSGCVSSPRATGVVVVCKEVFTEDTEPTEEGTES